MLKGMKRLAPIRHSWTCRASLSRQHYTMNTVILCQICLAFGLPFCPISMSYCFQNMSLPCVQQQLTVSDLWELNCWSSTSACIIVSQWRIGSNISKVHQPRLSSSSFLSWVSVRICNSQQVPVPNLTNVCSATVLWEASNCQATWTTNRMRWSAKTYSMKSQLIWQEPYHTLPNLQQRSS